MNAAAAVLALSMLLAPAPLDLDCDLLDRGRLICSGWEEFQFPPLPQLPTSPAPQPSPVPVPEPEPEPEPQRPAPSVPQRQEPAPAPVRPVPESPQVAPTPVPVPQPTSTPRPTPSSTPTPIPVRIPTRGEVAPEVREPRAVEQMPARQVVTPWDPGMWIFAGLAVALLTAGGLALWHATRPAHGRHRSEEQR